MQNPANSLSQISFRNGFKILCNVWSHIVGALRKGCIEFWRISNDMMPIDNTNDYDKMEDFLNNLRNTIGSPARLRRKMLEGIRD